MNTPVKTLIVDDQSLMRSGLCKLLELEPEVEVVAEAADGSAALRLLAREHIDVALVDARMPGMDGIILTQRVRQHYPDTAVIILTTFDDDAYITGGLRAGARGYLLKDTAPSDLVAAIVRVHRGETVLGTAAAERLVAMLSQPPEPEAANDIALSERENQIARLVGVGATNREIARRLFITEGTVKNHISHVLRKLHLRDRTQLAVYMNRPLAGQMIKTRLLIHIEMPHCCHCAGGNDGGGTMAKNTRKHRWFRFLRSRWFHVWLLMLALSFLLILIAAISGNQALIPAAFFYAAAAGPVALLVATHVRTGFGSTVPPATLLGMFLFGGGVALAIGGLLDQVIIGSIDSALIWWVGPIEEGAKFIPVLVVAATGRYLTKAGGLALGMSVAAGFAIMESVAYAYASVASGGLLAAEGVLVFRGLTTPFAHLAWTGLLCAVAFSAWQQRGRVAMTWSVATAFLLVAFLHSANDALMQDLPMWLRLLYLLVPITSYVLFHRFTSDLNLTQGVDSGRSAQRHPVNPSRSRSTADDLQDDELLTHAEEFENNRRSHPSM